MLMLKLLILIIDYLILTIIRYKHKIDIHINYIHPKDIVIVPDIWLIFVNNQHSNIFII